MPFLKKQPIFYLFIIFFVAWMGFYFININKVPFHPDETTQIYMSDDVDLFFSKPSSLFYSKTANYDQKQTYRLLDSPLTRYTIGFWRKISNQPILGQDWNWSASWKKNQLAIPDPALLFIARLGVAIVFPFSVLLLFFITRKLFSTTTAVIASFLFMSNAIILLHTRRAMAESLMLFFMLLSIWVIFNLKPSNFFLAAIPVAFAINTKQSLLFLIPAAVVVYLFRIKISWSVLKSIFFFLLTSSFVHRIIKSRPLESPH